MARLQKVRRFFWGVVTVTVTAGFVAASVVAVIYGQGALEARAAAKPEPEPAPLTQVSVQPLVKVPGYQQTRHFVGQIEPQRTVATSFELAGQLSQIVVDEGDIVSEGQLLAAQDVDLIEAERAALLSSREALTAQLDLALQRVERAEALLDRGFASQERLDEAWAARDELAARVREIDANTNSIDIRLEKSRIHAPFDGRVTRRFVDGGEAMSPGQPVLEVIETNAPLLRVGVPLSLDEDSLQAARVILEGTTYDATFLTIRPDIDAVTRTRTALFALHDAPALAFGQTAEVAVETTVETAGTWVPLKGLKEGARGQWTLLTLTEDDVVERATALVIHAESDRVFVQGSFADGARMIESGTQRVVPGQKVAPVMSDEG